MVREEDLAASTLGEVLKSASICAVPRSGRILFLHANAAALHGIDLEESTCTCVQNLRPLADTLQASGREVHAHPPHSATGIDLVLALPPRQREQARICLARAVAAVRAGGHVIVAMANREGAKSIERDLRDLAGPLQVRSLNKCRVFGGAFEARHIRHDKLQAWLALDALRPVADDGWVSRPGLFAWDRIDPASALLAAHIPTRLEGRLADLGAGFGYLSAMAVQACPGLTSIDLYEADARALEAARVNMQRACEAAHRDVSFDVHWHDVTRGLPGRYDAVISNPPFHQGRIERPELGRAFIHAAADALHPGGELWMVANRHLPYEDVLRARFTRVHTVEQRDGYKVISAERGHAHG